MLPLKDPPSLRDSSNSTGQLSSGSGEPTPPPGTSVSGKDQSLMSKKISSSPSTAKPWYSTVGSRIINWIKSSTIANVLKGIWAKTPFHTHSVQNDDLARRTSIRALGSQGSSVSNVFKGAVTKDADLKKTIDTAQEAVKAAEKESKEAERITKAIQTDESESLITVTNGELTWGSFESENWRIEDSAVDSRPLKVIQNDSGWSSEKGDLRIGKRERKEEYSGGGSSDSAETGLFKGSLDRQGPPLYLPGKIYLEQGTHVSKDTTNNETRERGQFHPDGTLTSGVKQVVSGSTERGLFEKGQLVRGTYELANVKRTGNFVEGKLRDGVQERLNKGVVVERVYYKDFVEQNAV